MKKIIFTLIMFFMMIPFTNAGSVNLSLSCPSSANKGDKINCTIKVTTDVYVNGVAANYNLSGLSYVSFTPKNDFQIYNSTESGFAVGNTKGKTGTFTVGVVTLKVTSSGSITLNNIDISDTNFEPYVVSNKTKSIRLKSTNNKLADLTISKGKLTPEFSSDVTSYTATVDDSSIKISATKSDSYQTVSGTGTKSLNYGKNTLKVVVKSESGISKTYTLVITRPDNRSGNNYLSSITLSTGTINFNKTTKSYTVNVDSNISTLKINATIEDSKASFVTGYGPRTVNLDYGKNTILIKSQAENKEVLTYTLIVNRKDNRSTNNYIKSLTLSEGNIVFDKKTQEYNITVLNEVESLEITPVLEDSKATLKISNKKLVVGENKINILVTSENGEKRTYTINVKRLSKEESLSDNNNVTDITITNHEFEFKSDVYEYKINIDKNESELLINVTLEDETATHTIIGNENLQDGSVIKVTSISESGKVIEYKFLITKATDITPYLIVGAVGVIIGFTIGFVLSLIIFALKNKKK